MSKRIFNLFAQVLDESVNSDDLEGSAGEKGQAIREAMTERGMDTELEEFLSWFDEE